jgi:TPP-dependent pyruvate/acetoin dehydrogenase alpha subunit
VRAVAQASAAAVGRLRQGLGPAVLECRTDRARGHFEGDAQAYRERAELEGLAARDPLAIVEAVLEREGVDAATRASMREEARATVRDALASAREDDWPLLRDAARDVYTDRGGAHA